MLQRLRQFAKENGEASHLLSQTSDELNQLCGNLENTVSEVVGDIRSIVEATQFATSNVTTVSTVAAATEEATTGMYGINK